MARRTNELVVILWRDIPAQVNVHIGRERRQMLLAERFQRAIDRAKRKARIHTAQDDVAQWRRESRPLDGEAEAAVADAVARLEADYPPARLGALAFVGGWAKDLEKSEVATS
ncbi:MAG: virulence factor [Acidimicrobiia bacterium]|nr:virulence factor [Acidimicrobiia bacterium]